MSHTAAVRASLAAIPRSRWRQKIARFVVALLLGALLYFVALPQKWSPLFVIGIAVAIGYCISSDLMAAIVKFLVAAIRDVAGALPTKTTTIAPPAAPPAETPRVTPPTP
jgi:hypothetical protein